MSERHNAYNTHEQAQIHEHLIKILISIFGVIYMAF